MSRIKIKLTKESIDFMKSKSNLLKPKISAIYFLKYNDEVVYVGQSKDIKNRIKSHIFEKEKLFSDFSFLECSHELLNETETAYIFKHDPIFNKKDSLTRGIETDKFCELHVVEYTTVEDFGYVSMNKINGITIATNIKTLMLQNEITAIGIDKALEFPLGTMSQKTIQKS